MKMAVTTLGSDGGLSGIGRYTSTLLQHWTSMQLDLRLFGHADDRSAFAPGAPDSQWVNVSDRWRLPVSSVFWHQALLPGLCKDVDVLFLPAGNRRLPRAPFRALRWNHSRLFFAPYPGKI